jgi:hypothetical protein
MIMIEEEAQRTPELNSVQPAARNCFNVTHLETTIIITVRRLEHNPRQCFHIPIHRRTVSLRWPRRYFRYWCTRAPVDQADGRCCRRMATTTSDASCRLAYLRSRHCLSTQFVRPTTGSDNAIFRHLFHTGLNFIRLGKSSSCDKAMLDC